MISKQKKLERVQISTNKNVIDYVISAMENGFYARGPHLKKLQNVLKNKFDKEYAILTTNGFSSLFLTLKALNLPKKNQVTTASAGTCFAMVNAIKAAGLKPKFVDLEKKTLSIQTKNLSSNKLNNNIVIIPNHFGLISEEPQPWKSPSTSPSFWICVPMAPSRMRMRSRAASCRRAKTGERGRAVAAIAAICPFSGSGPV